MRKVTFFSYSLAEAVLDAARTTSGELGGTPRGHGAAPHATAMQPLETGSATKAAAGRLLPRSKYDQNARHRRWAAHTSELWQPGKAASPPGWGCARTAGEEKAAGSRAEPRPPGHCPRPRGTPSAATPPGAGLAPQGLASPHLRAPASPAAQVPSGRPGAKALRPAGAGGWHPSGLRRMGSGARSAGNLPRVPRPRSGVPGAEGQPLAAAPLPSLPAASGANGNGGAARSWLPPGGRAARRHPAGARPDPPRGAERPGRAPGTGQGQGGGRRRLRERGRCADVPGGRPGMAGGALGCAGLCPASAAVPPRTRPSASGNVRAAAAPLGAG